MENASPPHETSVRPPPASLTSQDTEPPGRRSGDLDGAPAPRVLRQQRNDPTRGEGPLRPGRQSSAVTFASCRSEKRPPLDDTARARLITAESYRDAAFKHGIPFRPNGLFPIGDSLLTELAADSTLVPFQKNVVDVDDAGGARFALAGSWANGDLAAANGLDLRCFYRSESDARVKHGQLVAAFRLGDRAGIGHRMWTTAHGGSVSDPRTGANPVQSPDADRRVAVDPQTSPDRSVSVSSLADRDRARRDHG